MAVSNEAVQDILISDGAYLVVDEVRIIDTGVYIRLEGGLLLILGADTLVFRRDEGERFAGTCMCGRKRFLAGLSQEDAANLGTDQVWANAWLPALQSIWELMDGDEDVKAQRVVDKCLCDVICGGDGRPFTVGMTRYFRSSHGSLTKGIKSGVIKQLFQEGGEQTPVQATVAYQYGSHSAQQGRLTVDVKHFYATADAVPPENEG